LTLDLLPYQQRAVIGKIENNELSNKLIDMGLYPGKSVEVVFKAPFGDPIAVEVERYTLSLRKSEAALVEIY